MKLDKILFLIFCIVILSGCTATYNLDISSSGFSESVDVDFDNNDEYVKYYIPSIFGSMELEDPDSNFLTEVEGIDYYDIDESLVNDLNRINYSYRFDENNISKSNFINSAYNTFILKRYDHDEDGENDYMLFTTDDSFNLFERLDNLESVKINITCHYEVISSNADEVNNNVYTWYLTRDSSKSINLVYNPDNEIDDRSFWEKIMDSYYFDISIVCLGVLIVGGIIYLIMKNRSEKVDRI